MNHDPAARVVWIFNDGKPGHHNQCRGLEQALSQRLPLRSHWLSALGGGAALLGWLRRRFPQGDGLPLPDLLIGAGHATHLPMLAARRACGGRAVVLMKPSLPRACFDLCVIPEHDGVSGRNVLVTRGALNAVMPAEHKDGRAGLILIGGLSEHYAWPEDEVINQVDTIVARDNEIQWTVTSSRRTPASTLERLQSLRAKNYRFVPHTETDSRWLPQQLAAASKVWVSPDSVSMIYEALTAGAACGVLSLPPFKPNRITRGVERLIAARDITDYEAWLGGAALVAPAVAFNEAARVAAWIEKEWFPNS